MQASEMLTLIQTIILFGGFIIGIRQIILLSQQVLLMTNQIHNQFSWQKKNVTFDYLKKYTVNLRETIISLENKLGILKQNGKYSSLEEMFSQIKDTNTRVELYEIVSYFEHLAIGILFN